VLTPRLLTLEEAALEEALEAVLEAARAVALAVLIVGGIYV
jgi:hypothetical protein